MGTATSSIARLALIAMPWSIFNRPSIQLGALKAYLERESDHQVDTYHAYLPVARAISPEIYRQIALSGWAGEAVFAPLVFPEQGAAARKLFGQCLHGKVTPLPDFDELVTAVEKSCLQLLTTLPWREYTLVGFSLCFSQLFASLYLAQKIKDLSPQTVIVFGGSSCSGDIGRSLIDHFPQIDYLIDGEGERQLLHLMDFLSGKTTLSAKIRHQATAAPLGSMIPLAPLVMDDLPIPDYRPYFKQMQLHFNDQAFIPLVPVEFSRGCWWNKCTFCNLNLQWPNYRFKKSSRMLTEILHLAKVHECLHFSFTDNALPPQEADQFFKRLLPNQLDFDFFAEIRTGTGPEKLQLYQRAGLKTVQVGIEALATSLLGKMAKGTTVIDNIAAMKMCSASAIRLEGNLITDFPGTTAAEITETLDTLDYILPFRPLQAASFFLGFGSPLYHDCALTDHGSIQRIIPHGKNRSLFPKRYLQSMTMLINGYRADKKQQYKKWQPVKQKILAWQDFHTRRVNNRLHPLHYRDGGTFLIIRQERLSGTPLLHRLRGSSRKIYLFCDKPIRMTAILQKFPKISGDVLQKFIDEMCEKRLMFQENGRTLALAVPHTALSL